MRLAAGRLGSQSLFAEDVQRGGAVTGMRLGVAIDTHYGTKQLRVLLGNTLSTQWNVVAIADEGGGPPAIACYFDIYAVGGTGGNTEYSIPYFVGGDLGHIVRAGLTSPYVVSSARAGLLRESALPRVASWREASALPVSRPVDRRDRIRPGA